MRNDVDKSLSGKTTNKKLLKVMLTLKKAFQIYVLVINK